MGQYYTPVIVDGAGEITCLELNLEGETHVGMKLTEHSFLQNFFCTELCYRLSKKAKRVLWVGDYAHRDYLEGIDKELFDRAFEAAWKDSGEGKQLKMTFQKARFSIRGKYIVNYSKKEFVDVEAYIAASGQDYEKDSILHPLPLLTAIGNGQGGGDYYGANEDQVGRWCGDVIFVYGKEPPTEYTCLNVVFK